MGPVLHVHCGVHKCGDVVLKADAAHEIAEPRPDRKSVEFSEQRGVMKPDPPAVAFLDVVDEGGLRYRCPAVWRVVELQEQCVFCEKLGVDFSGVGNVVDCKMLARRQLVKPGNRLINKWSVDAGVLGQREYPKSRLCLRRLGGSPRK